MYDVIVVGAGPGGLKCAEQFSNSDTSVLLIEKNSEIGPKPCAGGLTNLTQGFEFPDDKTRTFYRQFIYVDEKRHFINLLNQIKTIDRYDLGQYQLDKIKNLKNITILKDTNVFQVKKNSVITNKGEFFFKNLVGADGAFSIVRKFLGLKNEISIGLYYKIPNITDEFAFYFYPKILKSGYIWTFPHREYTSVGIYCDPKIVSPKIAKDFLFDFSKKMNLKTSRLEGGSINSFYSGCIFKNIFLVGDAAGLTSWITGEGISFALISGEEIGKKIKDPNYKMNRLKRVVKIKKRQEKIKKAPFLFSRLAITLFVKLINNFKIQKYFGV